tara:strand:- start:490 stop:867 length:378 start_codon:yes stop_codon:yes gene_type:complete
MPSFKTHITNISTQKSYIELVGMIHTPPVQNLLKGQTGRVFAIHINYNNATKGYVHVYDQKGGVAVGTTLPIMTFPVVGTNSSVCVVSQQGILISEGLSIAGSNTAGTGANTTPAGSISAFIVGG